MRFVRCWFLLLLALSAPAMGGTTSGAAQFRNMYVNDSSLMTNLGITDASTSVYAVAQAGYAYSLGGGQYRWQYVGTSSLTSCTGLGAYDVLVLGVTGYSGSYVVGDFEICPNGTSRVVRIYKSGLNWYANPLASPATNDYNVGDAAAMVFGGMSGATVSSGSDCLMGNNSDTYNGGTLVGNRGQVLAQTRNIVCQREVEAMTHTRVYLAWRTGSNIYSLGTAVPTLHLIGVGGYSIARGRVLSGGTYYNRDGLMSARLNTSGHTPKFIDYWYDHTTEYTFGTCSGCNIGAFSHAYDPVNLKWITAIEASNQLQFHTSPERTTWTGTSNNDFHSEWADAPFYQTSLATSKETDSVSSSTAFLYAISRAGSTYGKMDLLRVKLDSSGLTSSKTSFRVRAGASNYVKSTCSGTSYSGTAGTEVLTTGAPAIACETRTTDDATHNCTIAYPSTDTDRHFKTVTFRLRQLTSCTWRLDSSSEADVFAGSFGFGTMTGPGSDNSGKFVLAYTNWDGDVEYIVKASNNAAWDSGVTTLVGVKSWYPPRIAYKETTGDYHLLYDRAACPFGRDTNSDGSCGSCQSGYLPNGADWGCHAP